GWARERSRGPGKDGQPACPGSSASLSWSGSPVRVGWPVEKNGLLAQAAAGEKSNSGRPAGCQSGSTAGGTAGAPFGRKRHGCHNLPVGKALGHVKGVAEPAARLLHSLVRAWRILLRGKTAPALARLTMAHDDLIRLMQSLFLPAADSYRDVTWQPPMDLYRTRTGWLLKLDLAGVRPDDIRVTVQGRRLSIRGMRRDWV